MPPLAGSVKAIFAVGGVLELAAARGQGGQVCLGAEISEDPKGPDPESESAQAPGAKEERAPRTNHPLEES
jgi:hypothetical protein